MFTPGSVVRLPVGYLWVMGIAVIALAVATYLAGHARGRSAGREQLARTMEATDRAEQETSRIREPSGGGTVGSAGSNGGAAESDPARPGPSSAEMAVSAPGEDVTAERRESGKMYYRVITTNRDEAIRTARLIRRVGVDLGLDAQVVWNDNPGLTPVILHPGIAVEDYTPQARARWNELILELGSRLVGEVKFVGRPFKDAYASQYR